MMFIFFLVACTPQQINPQQIIHVYADDTHIADIIVREQQLRVVVIEDKEISNLQTAVATIQKQETLPLETEVEQEIDGERVMTLVEVQVGPEHPDYIHAVAGALPRYGFLGIVDSAVGKTI